MRSKFWSFLTVGWVFCSLSYSLLAMAKGRIERVYFEGTREVDGYLLQGPWVDLLEGTLIKGTLATDQVVNGLNLDAGTVIAPTGSLLRAKLVRSRTFWGFPFAKDAEVFILYLGDSFGAGPPKLRAGGTLAENVTALGFPARVGTVLSFSCQNPTCEDNLATPGFLTEITLDKQIEYKRRLFPQAIQLHFNAEGDLESAVTEKDLMVQGIKIQGGPENFNRLDFYSTGALMRAVLAQDTEIQGVILSADSTIQLYPDGRLSGGIPSQKSSILGVEVSEGYWITLSPQGEVVWTADNRVNRMDPNSASFMNNFVFSGIPCLKGYVSFKTLGIPINSPLKGCFVSKDLIMNGVLRIAGEWVEVAE